MRTQSSIAARVITALAVLVTALLVAPPAVAAPMLNPGDQDSVRAAYHRQLAPALKVKPKWTGNTSKCSKKQPKKQPAAAVGAQSVASKKATFQAINYYRAMAGLKPVKENTPASARALQAALIMEANESLSHDPPSSWACYSQVGADSAASSNIAIMWGSPGTEMPAAQAIALYMDDYGDNNREVGHRRWLLLPKASEFGTGSTSNANAVEVSGLKQKNPHDGSGVGWPSKGYFPWEAMPTSKRWSYSQPYDGDVDFSKAKVTVTLGGKSQKVKVIARSLGDGWKMGEDSIVWEMPKLKAPAGAKIHTYTVTITGVKATSWSDWTTRKLPEISYRVHVFRANSVFKRTPVPKVSGTAAVGAKLTATAGTWKPASVKKTYQWYANGKKIEGATKTTLTLKAAHQGTKVTVKVTGTVKGQSVTKTSKAMRVVG